jgi:hypothetical protein
VDRGRECKPCRYQPDALCGRLDYLGLLDLWIKDRRRVAAWWSLAREWPGFKTGLRDLISEAEFSEMRDWGENCAVTRSRVPHRRRLIP